MIGNIVAAITDGGEAATDFESIATVTVGAGGSSSISFSSIPTTYQHLHIRLSLQTNRTGNVNDNIRLRVNGDTGSTGNYTRHQLSGDGSTASGGNAVGDVPLFINPTVSQTSTNTFGAHVIDILDYANTNKLKTIRTLGGFDANGSGTVALYSGWVNLTAAVTSLEFLPQSGTLWNQSSRIALYGIKG